MILGFIPNQVVQSIVSFAWFVLIAIILVDSTILVLRLKAQLKERFPEKSERKGASVLRDHADPAIAQTPPTPTQGQAWR